MTFYTFANSTTSIPLANLDANFATPITLGNTAVTINGTFSSIGNLTLNNATIASGNSTVTKETVTTITSPAATNLTIQSAGTTAMTIDTSQNVAIGTPTAVGKLTTLNLSATSTTQYGNILGWFSANATNADCSIGLSNGVDASARIGIVGGSNMYFSQNGAERMRIDSNGNLLVGATAVYAPVTVWKVASNSNLGQICAAGQASGDAGSVGLSISKFDNNTTTSQRFISFLVNNTGAGSGQINANGANAAAFGSYSDQRLKENIVGLPSQLDNICALRPVEFDYKDGSGHQIGFIAQEMQEVYPDAVGTGADDMLTVTGWSKTEARLVAAIQELKAEFDAYKASHP